MGIRGLRFFLSRNCPSTVRPRDIVMITSTYHRKTSKTPTIIVDAPTCIFSLFDKIDLYCPGQIQEVKEIVENFVNAFRKNNIKLIFFFDGPWLPDEHLEEYWRSNRAIEVSTMLNTMNDIKEGEIEKSGTQIPRLSWVGIFFRLFLKVLYKDDPLVEVYFAMENTRTLVIADYAISNDSCVAILSDDTIYLYYTDTVPVMSCKKLDLTKMTTLISNRNEICRELQIKKEHLKILASLTASEDLIDLEEYYPFYEFITDGRYDPRTVGLPYPFEDILQYIRRFGNLSYKEIVDRLTEDITIHGTEDLAELLRTYLMNYELNRRNPNFYKSNRHIEGERAAEFTDHESIANVFTRKLITCDIFTMALELIKFGRVVIWTTPLQDIDDCTLVGHVQLFRAIRQRLYGFIYNSPGIESKNIIEVWASFDCEHTEESVDPIAEPFNELSLTMLWKSPVADTDVRMDCLLKCFGFTLADDFLDIPIKFQPLVIVLRYMFKHPQMNISEWEIGSFIVQAITLSVDNPDNKFNQTLESLDSRACHLAGLFVDGITLFCNVSLCCRLDLQLFMPWNYFDGKRFQYYYQRMKSGLTAVDLLSESGEDVEFLNKKLLVSVTS